MYGKKFLNSYTGRIISINVVFYILILILMNIFGVDKIINLVALNPLIVLSGKNIWTFITSMFMHGNFTHLILNMISLFFIGSFVERLIGKKRFLYFYFGAGLFAGILFVALTKFTGGNLNIAAVGASGAIFGLGGLLAVLTPKLPVLVFFIIPMPMWMAMIALLGILWILSWGVGLPIGNIAHLGGLLIGVAYGFYLKQKYPKKTQMISKYFSR